LASTGQVLDECIEVVNDDLRMRLTSGPEVVLDAKVKLSVPGAKPHAAGVASTAGLSISAMPRTSTKNARAAASSPRGIASCT
jgi:hypothetical protein